ncbi:hypothetical protein [Endozoicomonas sp.]|uniref:hypothetical protein n=1 Tax=Endozoicomonas sp. TaxID=1892382 RepID=UPI00383A95C2
MKTVKEETVQSMNFLVVIMGNVFHTKRYVILLMTVLPKGMKLSIAGGRYQKYLFTGPVHQEVLRVMSTGIHAFQIDINVMGILTVFLHALMKCLSHAVLRMTKIIFKKVVVDQDQDQDQDFSIQTQP